MKNLYEPGEQIETTIVEISKDTVFLDLSLKCEGILDKKEVTDADGNCTVNVGDKITVYFLSGRGEELTFTTKIVGGSKVDNSIIESAFKNGIPVEGHVEKEIKGGYEVKINGARAFCPYSQMGYKQKAEPAEYVGQKLTFKIMEYKNDGKDILVSNRAIGEEKENERLAKLADSIKVGDVVKGTIASLQSYGAFVDLNGFQALIPISEMSFKRIKDASEVVAVGDVVEAKVIKADWAHQRVSVSMKALQKDPWELAAENFPAGTKIEGKIARVADFGIFVNLAEGIDGLVHISLLDVDKNTNIKKVFKTGDDFAVIVEKVDAEEKRISLKPVSAKKEEDDAKEYLASHSSDDDEGYNPFATLLKR